MSRHPSKSIGLLWLLKQTGFLSTNQKQPCPWRHDSTVKVTQVVAKGKQHLDPNVLHCFGSRSSLNKLTQMNTNKQKEANEQTRRNARSHKQLNLSCSVTPEKKGTLFEEDHF